MSDHAHPIDPDRVAHAKTRCWACSPIPSAFA
jgi:hypothetical protein